MSYETILVERRDRVAVITLNRPKQLNALNVQMARDLTDAARELDADESVGCMVVTGSAKAFAAGADIKEMTGLSYMDAHRLDWFHLWDLLGAVRKPIIAAVSGYALGGGCELAMICDFIIAADTAKFGQPEIKLGVMPGIGGSQRLTRAVGKAKAMDMVLTGRMMDAAEAERSGLVSRVVAPDRLMDEALEAAKTIAAMSLPSTRMNKEAVNVAFETGLAQGVRFERRLFQATFAMNDQKEGMAAFVEKRPAQFSHD
ncbi:enoyl-CoA hydratase [Rhodoblastus acidophilus]|uniref:enoyl-CoA hydratase n=1 Tax=Rhodoblastus acidophilus TaxID=1074 RepID=A0A212R4T1_RHOAC|nr:enoyl-CoA hydratase [Rhodoblastus acidophilus]PPQ36530.1 enoyl-CoA hydratase [Rhodoblastus acidophilus]RAI16937.1 enoyl-CoA hydratase [Rhodoblastus acidophilus]SNB66895.1 enoyl-CoA hydratase [Rhodoblastus acidophilus]